MEKFKITDVTTVGALKKSSPRRLVVHCVPTMVVVRQKMRISYLNRSEARGSLSAGLIDLLAHLRRYLNLPWVKVLDNITLETASKLPNGMTKAMMEKYVSNYAK